MKQASFIHLGKIRNCRGKQNLREKVRATVCATFGVSEVFANFLFCGTIFTVDSHIKNLEGTLEVSTRGLEEASGEEAVTRAAHENSTDRQFPSIASNANA